MYKENILKLSLEERCEAIKLILKWGIKVY
jgi:hypothetical protein